MAHIKIKINEQQRKKCHAIIHSHSALAAGAGTGLAQVPLADSTIITPIQIAMIIELGTVFHKTIEKSAADAIIKGAASALIGRSVSQVLVGWVPIVGNAINSATAAGLTEAIGWLAVKQFAESEAVSKRGDESASDNRQGDESASDNRQGNEEKSSDALKEAKEQYLIRMKQFLNGELQYCENEKEYHKLYTDVEVSGLFSNDSSNEIYLAFKELPFDENKAYEMYQRSNS